MPGPSALDGVSRAFVPRDLVQGFIYLQAFFEYYRSFSEITGLLLKKISKNYKKFKKKSKNFEIFQGKFYFFSNFFEFFEFFYNFL